MCASRSIGDVLLPSFRRDATAFRAARWLTIPYEVWLGTALLVATPSCLDALEREDRRYAGMFIESCSLACSRGNDGVQVFMGIPYAEAERWRARRIE